MSAETKDSSNLEIAYQALISQYLYLLRSVASGQVGLATRRLIEDHVRIKLGEILQAFTIQEHSLLISDQDTDLSYLRQEIDQLTRLADQLANLEPFRLQLIKFAWSGLAIFFAYAVLDFSGSSTQIQNIPYILDNWLGIFQTFFLTFGVILLILSAVFFGVADYFMRQKRFYLKPGYDEYDNRRMTSPETKEGVNTYKMEDDLFLLLERKKPKETPWDVVGQELIVFSISTMVLAFILFFRSVAPNPFVLWGAGLVAAMIIYLSIGKDIRDRLKREM